MKIPLIDENGDWIYEWMKEGEEEYPKTIVIDLNHPKAVEMAKRNVEWQVDDEYFDATFEIWIDYQLFYSNHTTDAFMTWKVFLDAISEQGEHSVLFLDSDHLTVKHSNTYELIYEQLDYEWDENNIITNVESTGISSGPLRKEDFERAIIEGFIQYANFILENDIPISEDYKEVMKIHLQRMKS